jgi:hypothetical protein
MCESVLYQKLLVHNVHCYFKAKSHFCSSWFSPHSISPYKLDFSIADKRILTNDKVLVSNEMYEFCLKSEKAQREGLGFFEEGA